MRLKRLVCRGFKSFADRTEFDFDSRLTGIIGPNGCGKSNVVDALKWVLGDQRAKSLRGSEMTDVIFKGAEGRDALGLADVRVVLEDPEGRFDGHSELEIGRTLTRDKESSYLVNGQSLRLKDVRDVLLDTGLGVGGYSVMEQGRIDAVLSANPESRRAIFEEAAGISRFKLQKKESLRKLERTEQNLARVEDLLEERARRIRSLKIQAGKARRYRELKAQLRDLKAALAVLEAREHRERMAGLEADRERLQAEVVEASAQRDQAAEALREAEQAIAEGSSQLEHAQEAVHAVRERYHAASQRAEAQRGRAQELEDDAGAAEKRAGVLQEQRVEREAALQLARETLESREAELVELGGQLDERNARLGELQAELRILREGREELRARLLEHIHRRTRARNHAHDQQAQLRSLRARTERVDDRLEHVVEAAAGTASDLERVGVSLTQLGSRRRILEEREERALGDLQAADEAAALLALEEAELRRELSEIEGRAAALEDMEAHMEGLDEGPRYLLESRPEGLRGRLLDLLEIDLEYSTALEAALGPFVQALVVDTRANAEAIVKNLEERERGRVLLLVEEEFGEELELPSSLPTPGGAPFLSELVRCPEGESGATSRRLLRWLLRGVVLVEDLSEATAGRADLCFVTRSGTLLCGPKLEGGAGDHHSGLIQRRSKILALREEADGLQLRLSDLAQGAQAAQGRVEKLKGEVRSLGEALKVARRLVQEAEGEQARFARFANDLQNERADLEAESTDLRRGTVAALAALGTHLMNVHLVERMESADNARESEVADELALSQKQVDEAAQAVQELRLRQVAAQSDRDGQRDTIRMHEEALRDLDRANVDLRERIDTARAGAAKAREVVLAEEQAAKGLSEEIEAAQEERDGVQAALEERRRDREQVQGVQREWEQRHAAANEALTDLRLEVSDVEHRFARLEERLADETGVALRRCLGEVEGLGLIDPLTLSGPVPPADATLVLQGPFLPPKWVAEMQGLGRLWEQGEFDRKESQKEVKVLQSSVERLGSVNLDAVEELAQEEQNFGLVEQEVEDLKEARRSLMETLRRLEAESRAMFLETFQQARENFQHIFRKLFQGGKADMYLVDEEDALESGIQIMARPPGKQLQSINLLSGGERSMTALAILFAVFKVKPSPFCILDEVDAALDDTNVERFLRVLRDFVEETQFCIVTHHKRTMAECSQLYGITMQKRGVSSRMAVNLDEVDQIAEGRALEKERIAGEERVAFEE